MNFAYNAGTATLTVDRELQLDFAQALTNADYSSLLLRNQSFTVSHVATGDEDGINLPWFNKADAGLLFFELHGDEREVSLEVQRYYNTSANRVYLSIFSSRGNSEPIIHTAGFRLNPNRLPLLTIGFDLPTASLKNVSMEQRPSFTFPSSFSCSPSLTFPIRKAVQVVLTRAFYLASASAALFWIVFRLAASIGLLVVLVWLWRQYRASRQAQEADLEIGHVGETTVVDIPSSKEGK